MPKKVRAGRKGDSSIELTWDASTDNLGVTGYGVYLEGELVTSVAEQPAQLDGLACGVYVTLEVDAHDRAGNRSAKASTIGRTSSCPRDKPNPHTSRERRSLPESPTWPWPEPPPARAPEPPPVEPKKPPRRGSGFTWARAEIASTLSDLTLALHQTWPLTALPAPRGSVSVVLGLSPVAAPGQAFVDWDHQRFETRGALRVHLQWSGASWTTWVRQHRQAFERLPA
jgi:hypothetical protein